MGETVTSRGVDAGDNAHNAAEEAVAAAVEEAAAVEAVAAADARAVTITRVPRESIP